MIILVVEPYINGGIEIPSTNESLRPIGVIVHDLQLGWERSTVWPITCLVFIVTIIFHAEWLNTVIVDGSSRNSGLIIYETVVLNVQYTVFSIGSIAAKIQGSTRLIRNIGIERIVPNGSVGIKRIICASNG